MKLRALLAMHLIVFATFLALPSLATQPPQDDKKEPDKKEFGGEKVTVFKKPQEVGARAQLAVRYDVRRRSLVMIILVALLLFLIFYIA